MAQKEAAAQAEQIYKEQMATGQPVQFVQTSYSSADDDGLSADESIPSDGDAADDNDKESLKTDKKQLAADLATARKEQERQ